MKFLGFLLLTFVTVCTCSSEAVGHASPFYKVTFHKKIQTCSTGLAVTTDIELVCTESTSNSSNLIWKPVYEGGLSEQIQILVRNSIALGAIHKEPLGLVWVDASKENVSLVPNKVIGGHEADGEELYICRTNDPNNSHKDQNPGKLSSRLGVCFARGHQEDLAFSSYFQILTNPDQLPLRWVQDSKGHVPSNAVTGGQMFGDGAYYIGRFNTGNSLQPGQIDSVYTEAFFYYDHAIQYQPHSSYQFTFGRGVNNDSPMKQSSQYEVLVVNK